jgi:hypothetical protein
MGWKSAFERWGRTKLAEARQPLMYVHLDANAFLAGYQAAQRDAKAAEEKSRQRLGRAEAAIALQVASGGVAGDVDQVAEAGRLLEAVERVQGMGKRVA